MKVFLVKNSLSAYADYICCIYDVSVVILNNLVVFFTSTVTL